jgi:hypothetical protein
MPYRPSWPQIRSNARRQVARLQARARRAVQDNQRHMEQRVRSITNNGARPLTRSQIEMLARESASRLRSRLK